MKKWGKMAYNTIPDAVTYVKKIGRDFERYKDGIDYFSQSWANYLKQRGLWDASEPQVSIRLISASASNDNCCRK